MEIGQAYCQKRNVSSKNPQTPEGESVTATDVGEILLDTRPLQELCPQSFGSVDGKQGLLLVPTRSIEPVLRWLDAASRSIKVLSQTNICYSHLQAAGCFEIEDWYEKQEVVEASVLSSAILTLVKSGQAVIDPECSGHKMRLMLAPYPPERHLLFLELYRVEVGGATYWLAVPCKRQEKMSDEDFIECCLKMILEADGSYEKVDKLTPEMILENFECDDLPTIADIKQIDREEGIHTTCHVDDGRDVITMWAAFCDTAETGIVACSEW